MAQVFQAQPSETQLTERSNQKTSRWKLTLVVNGVGENARSLKAGTKFDQLK